MFYARFNLLIINDMPTIFNLKYLLKCKIIFRCTLKTIRNHNKP